MDRRHCQYACALVANGAPTRFPPYIVHVRWYGPLRSLRSLRSGAAVAPDPEKLTGPGSAALTMYVLYVTRKENVNCSEEVVYQSMGITGLYNI